MYECIMNVLCFCINPGMYKGIEGKRKRRAHTQKQCHQAPSRYLPGEARSQVRRPGFRQEANPVSGIIIFVFLCDGWISG